MLLLKLAARNLLRNRRRSLITMAAISFGMMLMDFTICLQHGTYQDMIRSGVGAMAGHVVIQGEGFEASGGDSEILVVESSETAARLEAAVSVPGVVFRRDFLSGLLSSSGGSSAVMVTAVDPVLDKQVGKLHDYLRDGEWLEAERDILIGSVLAERLDVGLGDKLVFMTQLGDEMTSKLFRLKGVLHSGAPDQDGMIAAVTLKAAQTLRGGLDSTTQVAMILDDASQWPTAVAEAKAALSGGPVEVLSWKEALPDMAAFITVDRRMGQGMLSILGVIVALGVFNTFLMSVLERTREFGVLLAIGTKPRQISQIVLLEAVVLGAVSIGLGTALGAAVTWPAVIYGLDFSSQMGEGMSNQGVVMSSQVFAVYNWPRMLVFAVGGFCLTVLAAVWPAWRVGKLTPVEAMRHH
jgi:ABC-type lipoprotein release transport system permease subunit